MEKYKLWDLPTRLFHWALVALIAVQYASAELHLLSMTWHFRFGYATLALILFRVVWGFVGSDTARFRHFVRGLRAVVRYVADTVARRSQNAVGHNPLGGWSVVVMIGLVLAQTVTGLFASDDIADNGPLSGRVSEHAVATLSRLHRLGWNVLLIVIGLHVVAVLVHYLVKRDDLVLPMVHGRTPLEGARELRFVSTVRALIVLAICALLVWGIVEIGAVE